MSTPEACRQQSVVCLQAGQAWLESLGHTRGRGQGSVGLSQAARQSFQSMLTRGQAFRHGLLGPLVPGPERLLLRATLCDGLELARSGLNPRLRGVQLGLESCHVPLALLFLGESQADSQERGSAARSAKRGFRDQPQPLHATIRMGVAWTEEATERGGALLPVGARALQHRFGPVVAFAAVVLHGPIGGKGLGVGLGGEVPIAHQALAPNERWSGTLRDVGGEDLAQSLAESLGLRPIGLVQLPPDARDRGELLLVPGLDQGEIRSQGVVAPPDRLQPTVTSQDVDQGGDEVVLGVWRTVLPDTSSSLKAVSSPMCRAKYPSRMRRAWLVAAGPEVVPEAGALGGGVIGELGTDEDGRVVAGPTPSDGSSAG